MRGKSLEENSHSIALYSSDLLEAAIGNRSSALGIMLKILAARQLVPSQPHSRCSCRLFKGSSPGHHFLVTC